MCKSQSQLYGSKALNTDHFLYVSHWNALDGCARSAQPSHFFTATYSSRYLTEPIGKTRRMAHYDKPLTISDMLERIEQLEQRVKELSERSFEDTLRAMLVGQREIIGQLLGDVVKTHPAQEEIMRRARLVPDHMRDLAKRPQSVNANVVSLDGKKRYTSAEDILVAAQAANEILRVVSDIIEVHRQKG